MTCRLKCVRDWSGILCEPCGEGNGSGEGKLGTGSGEGKMGNGKWEWERGGDGASKDRAESPTACRNAKRELKVEN